MVAPAVKSGYISNGPDLQLNYLEWGDPSAPPVLLIIGLTGIAYTWRQTAERLQDRYRCIALNLRGHGDSGPSPEREYSFDLWDSDVQALVNTLELDRPVVIGHSLGGRVAFVYAGRHPESTRGIVVVDVGPGFPVEAAQRVQRNFFGNRPPDSATWEEGVKVFPRGPKVSDEIAHERAPYALRQVPGGRVVFKHDPLLRDEWLGDKPPARAQAHSWLWQDLANVQCPTLFVKGEVTDFLTHELLDKMCDTTKGEARWVEVPGTTHHVMDDDLDAFIKHVRPFTDNCFSR